MAVGRQAGRRIEIVAGSKYLAAIRKAAPKFYTNNRIARFARLRCDLHGRRSSPAGASRSARPRIATSLSGVTGVARARRGLADIACPSAKFEKI